MKRMIGVVCCVVALQACAARQSGQTDADYTAQRLESVLTYAEALVGSVPGVVSRWELQGVISPEKAAYIRQWYAVSVTVLGRARELVALYRQTQSVESEQAMAAILVGVLEIVNDAVLVIYGGPSQ